MKEQLQKDMIEAMKTQNKVSLDTIKMLKAAIQMEEINKKQELNEEEIMGIVNKQVKMRNDAISEFSKAGRNDLIDGYNAEIGVLKKYLPKELSEEEVLAIINEAFEKVQPSSQKDMGFIMKEISPKLKNRTNMGKVNQIIREKLQ